LAQKERYYEDELAKLKAQLEMAKKSNQQFRNSAEDSKQSPEDEKSNDDIEDVKQEIPDSHRKWFSLSIVIDKNSNQNIQKTRERLSPYPNHNIGDPFMPTSPSQPQLKTRKTLERKKIIMHHPINDSRKLNENQKKMVNEVLGRVIELESPLKKFERRRQSPSYKRFSILKSTPEKTVLLIEPLHIICWSVFIWFHIFFNFLVS
jgi:hypothetical protein